MITTHERRKTIWYGEKNTRTQHARCGVVLRFCFTGQKELAVNCSKASVPYPRPKLSHTYSPSINELPRWFCCSMIQTWPMPRPTLSCYCSSEFRDHISCNNFFYLVGFVSGEDGCCLMTMPKALHGHQHHLYPNFTSIQVFNIFQSFENRKILAIWSREESI
ncbi:hypothetical protein NE237_008197 [Protea cynaroides]|uniref:Uncharacterized protein n=1 Tax=Protea cynaroides TaxID=273540 RepID=A0A9Q0KQL3_9MAGN|nr:hypothetical protein NE237_008197 [Protea cynaroides]